MKTVLKAVIVATLSVFVGVTGALKWMRSNGWLWSPAETVFAGYKAIPTVGCGLGCEWRQYAPKVWELDNWDKGTVARIYPEPTFPGHWYVQVNGSSRVWESDWPQFDMAKRHAELLAVK